MTLIPAAYCELTILNVNATVNHLLFTCEVWTVGISKAKKQSQYKLPVNFEGEIYIVQVYTYYMKNEYMNDVHCALSGNFIT